MAYLLLLSVMPFFFVKAFHVHEESVAHHGKQTPHHDSADKCAICLFTLSSFTEAESLEYNHTLTVKPVEYLFLEEQDVTATVLLLSLRAPPVRMSYSPWITCIM
ncbi:hypothetical protein GAZ35_18330 [Bacteroides xylanisolvens]|nr:hypothetical protein GAZ35_18330 [Bacteroides xylanisolvens]